MSLVQLAARGGLPVAMMYSFMARDTARGSPSEGMIASICLFIVWRVSVGERRRLGNRRLDQTLLQWMALAPKSREGKSARRCVKYCYVANRAGVSMLLFKVLTVELTGTNHRYVGADRSAPNWLLAGLDCCAASDPESSQAKDQRVFDRSRKHLGLMLAGSTCR